MTLNYNQRIWDDASTYEESKTPHFAILTACKHNDFETVKKLIGKTPEWTPFELMILVIFGISYKDPSTFYFMLSMLTKDDATRTFMYGPEEHTLLTLTCKMISGKSLYVQDILLRLLQLGCLWDQTVKGGKTALSFMVTSDSALHDIKWCIRQGATVCKGHLLVYASNAITKQQQEECIAAQVQYNDLESRGIITLEPIEVVRCNGYDNYNVFTYLLDIGVPVDDVVPESGMTPLLAACCENDLYKVEKLLKKGVSLYRNTLEGLDAWFWAEQHYYQYFTDLYGIMYKMYKMYKIYDVEKSDNNVTGTRIYPLRTLLLRYESYHTHYWKDMMKAVCTMPMLQEIPSADLLQTVVRI